MDIMNSENIDGFGLLIGTRKIKCYQFIYNGTTFTITVRIENGDIKEAVKYAESYTGKSADYLSDDIKSEAYQLAESYHNQN